MFPEVRAMGEEGKANMQKPPFLILHRPYGLPTCTGVLCHFHPAGRMPEEGLRAWL